MDALLTAPPRIDIDLFAVGANGRLYTSEAFSRSTNRWLRLSSSGLVSARIPWKTLATIQRTRRRIRAQPDLAHGNGGMAWDRVFM